MKIYKGPPPSDLPETHVKVRTTEFLRELDAYGVPVRRYTDGAGLIWAPRWACVLVSEWIDLGGDNAFSVSILRRIVSFISRTGETEFAEACLTVARLEGKLAVEKMLSDRKDMVQ